jgi:arginyl-tRNA--protein-N-Asp/Glu arginylyltransferase
MSYKAQFRPHEQLVGDAWVRQPLDGRGASTTP